MKLELSIDCVNAALCDEDGVATPESAAPDLARILRAVAYRTESGETGGKFRDYPRAGCG
jgi:hypothetical protein